MLIPTAQEIVFLYLYGQRTPPADLKSDALIRPAGQGAKSVRVDVNEYMTVGGGRFIKQYNFAFVRKFLGSQYYINRPQILPSTYTFLHLFMLYGIPKESNILGRAQLIFRVATLRNQEVFQ